MTTKEADRLSRAHRRAQVALRAQLLRDLLKIWPLLDLENIRRTWPGFEEALVALIRARGRTSRGAAMAYYRDIRRAAGIRGESPDVIADVPLDEVRDGLMVVGAVRPAQQLARGRRIEEVRAAALVNVSGESTRHLLNFGRAALLGLMAADTIGGRGPRQRRVTDSNPCPWCADQATRTYPATSRFPAHMHCACFPAPVF